MFKFKISNSSSMRRLSSSSLILLAIGSLLLINSFATVHTSEIQDTIRSQQSNDVDFSSHQDGSNSQQQPHQITNDTSSLESDNADSRKMRGSRMYNQAGFGSQQQASMDSYAAAYAAANSPSSSDHAQDLVQTSVQANDAANYASFGESIPSGSSPNGLPSVGSAARQLQTQTVVDYSPHASYYSSYLAPSSQTARDYSGQPSSASFHAAQAYHAYPSSFSSSAKDSRPMGYPTNGGFDRHAASNSYYDRASYLGAASMPLWASSPATSSGGLMSSASTALSSWTSGFSVAEIICGLIAISIGAIILGAPFFLIYLALMGNFSGSGTLSLTNPTGGANPAAAATTTVNGRRKRLAIFEQLTSSVNHKSALELGSFADAIAHHLSPYVDLQQVASTFKRLVGSIDKYSNMSPEAAKKKTNAQ